MTRTINQIICHLEHAFCERSLLRLPHSNNGDIRNNNMILNYSKYLLLFLLLGFLSSCSSTRDYSEYDNTSGTLIETGIASWYGPNFNGKLTASGETYDMDELTAAHRTLPFNSILRVINRSNNKSVIVRINDRGPYAKNRIIDLSKKAAQNINMIDPGSVPVDLILLNNSKLPIDLKSPHYSVQVGSFRSKLDAKKVADKIDDSRIVESIVDGETYYRIYVGLFRDKTNAEALKEALQDEGIDGFVKQFEN